CNQPIACCILHTAHRESTAHCVHRVPAVESQCVCPHGRRVRKRPHAVPRLRSTAPWPLEPGTWRPGTRNRSRLLGGVVSTGARPHLSCAKAFCAASVWPLSASGGLDRRRPGSAGGIAKTRAEGSRTLVDRRDDASARDARRLGSSRLPRPGNPRVVLCLRLASERARGTRSPRY